MVGSQPVRQGAGEVTATETGLPKEAGRAGCEAVFHGKPVASHLQRPGQRRVTGNDVALIPTHHLFLWVFVMRVSHSLLLLWPHRLPFKEVYQLWPPNSSHYLQGLLVLDPKDHVDLY